MYTLYWDRRTRAASVHMLLEEATIPYRLERINLRKGEHNNPDFLAINPKGFIPALVTETGEILSETGAMLLHIADKHDVKGLVPTPDDPDRGQFLDWFFFHLNVLQEPYKRFFFSHRYSNDGAHMRGIKSCAAENIGSHWDYLEVHLAANGPFHLGDRFGLNDILLATYGVFTSWKPDFFTSYPAVARCFGLVKSRPALSTIMQEHETPDS